MQMYQQQCRSQRVSQNRRKLQEWNGDGIMVKTQTFNGRRYKIVHLGNVDGFCDTKPTMDELVNCCKKGTQNELITWIHEAMHAGNWDKHEETVDRSSKEIGRLLWRLGYRR